MDHGRHPVREYACAALVTCCLLAGCARPLIKAPIEVPGGDFDVTLRALMRGPDQYNTAGGYWKPRRGTGFIWATVAIRNGGSAAKTMHLNDIRLIAGGRTIRPFILDMASAVTMRANPEPSIKPDESITRRIIYVVPAGDTVEKVLIQPKGEILIPR
ncbi:MAG: hypothetical protein JW838_15565 [Spirochaetes bacterium]|nr:hypothetical protein [Spirochaetota bacterium]